MAAEEQMQAQEEVYDGEELEEVYDEEIPVDGSKDMTGVEADDLEAMKRKLKEMEEEASRLRAATSQGDGGSSAGAAAAAAAAAAAQAEAIAAKEEADSRSIYVGNVDYSCTPEELQQHFQSCGTVNRVTILTDRFGNPKGYAYVEFLEVDAVSNAILLDNTDLRGRPIKVVKKRTNVPGLKVPRGRGRGRGGYTPYGGRGGGGGGYGGYGGGYGGYGGRGRGAYGGFAPRGRGRGRFFSPY